MGLMSPWRWGFSGSWIEDVDAVGGDWCAPAMCSRARSGELLSAPPKFAPPKFEGWWDALSKLRRWHDHMLAKLKMAKIWSKLC
ncbi:hypothetical protein PAHAL_9G572000 [Panicum hallii]|nr:hypothetical protein PAHAL_9G572000 [Panicum hallii]PVH33115.1 hypothetical protein PAHAL_9G572000 [Panicum hallii]